MGFIDCEKESPREELFEESPKESTKEELIEKPPKESPKESPKDKLVKSDLIYLPHYGNVELELYPKKIKIVYHEEKKGRCYEKEINLVGLTKIYGIISLVDLDTQYTLIRGALLAYVNREDEYTLENHNMRFETLTHTTNSYDHYDRVILSMNYINDNLNKLVDNLGSYKYVNFIGGDYNAYFQKFDLKIILQPTGDKILIREKTVESCDNLLEKLQKTKEIRERNRLLLEERITFIQEKCQACCNEINSMREIIKEEFGKCYKEIDSLREILKELCDVLTTNNHYG